jgi:hypothetical protein
MRKQHITFSLIFFSILLLANQTRAAGQFSSVREVFIKQATKPKVKKAVYRVWVTTKDNSKKQVLAGYLYNLTDSSISIIQVQVVEGWLITADARPLEIPFDKIVKVKVRKDKLGLKAFFYGFLGGFVGQAPILLVLGGGYTVVGALIISGIFVGTVVGLTALALSSASKNAKKFTDIYNEENKLWLQERTMMTNNIQVTDLVR